MAAVPWNIIIPIVLSIVSGMFKKDEGTQMMDKGLQMKSTMDVMGYKPPYQSPMLKQLDPVVAQALLNQLKQYSNFGMPEGMSMPTDFMNILLPSGSSRQPIPQGGTRIPL